MKSEAAKELADIINDLEIIRKREILDWIQEHSDELTQEGQTMVRTARELLDIVTDLLDKIKC